VDGLPNEPFISNDLLTVPIRSRSPSLSSASASNAALIWAFFREARDDEEGFHKDAQHRKFRLHYCLKCSGKNPTKTPWKGHFTSNAEKHLWTKHDLDVDACKRSYKNTNI
jgi:hypothetical protein